MSNSIRVSLIATFLGAVFAPSVYAACDVNDFLVGNPAIAANACFEGYTKPKQIEGAVESTLGGDWTIFGKYEKDDGSEIGSLEVDISEVYDNGFDWTLTDPSELFAFQNAVFVVKQGNSNSTNNVDGVAWVAYLVQNIEESYGSFFTETNFTVNDYSFLAAFGNGERAHTVPEIDGASAGIAFSFLLSLIAFIRERRIRRTA